MKDGEDGRGAGPSLPDELRARIAALAATGVGDAESDDGDAEAMAEEESAAPRDPHLSDRTVRRLASQSIGYGYLVGADDEEEPVPSEATSWVATWFE